MHSNPSIREAAERLARFHREADPGVVKIIWFPNDREVRLVDVDETAAPHESEGRIVPYLFGADAAVGVPFPSGVAVVTPGDLSLPPPEGWGSGWEEGEVIWAKRVEVDDEAGVG